MTTSPEAAIVTGGSRGIGRAISQRLAARGVAVCINYTARAAEAEALAAEIRAQGGRAIAVGADVADPNSPAGRGPNSAPSASWSTTPASARPRPWKPTMPPRWIACARLT